MTSPKPLAVALIALLVALASTPRPARASWDVQILPQAGSISPDGRHALLRLRTCSEGSDEAGPEVLVLIDVADGSIRPITHEIHLSATSPDGSLVAFATQWGVFLAAPGEPTIGRTLEWRGWRSAIDLAWRDSHSLRVLGGYLDESLTDIDLDTGMLRREPLPNGRSARALDAAGEPTLDEPAPDASGRWVYRRANVLPEVLPSASMLGWTADGRAILGHAERHQYWLVTPASGEVEIVGEHPGAVAVDPRLELRRRVAICPHSFATDVWLHDGRPGGRPRLVYAFHGRFGGGIHADSVITWTTEIGVPCAPS